ncbi:hypothetical protein SCHPADRAFT_496168 [Schizopora paradoxa]|uniref:Uncharacterized protein n=1 Tax=Schizopora paradoxa TaxID=27342 RepID=A0A0H2RGB0_9AGAM|nr:hypothetical protein SCHPADRAFT_496168 [Schizopora paradoxa]
MIDDFHSTMNELRQRGLHISVVNRSLLVSHIFNLDILVLNGFNKGRSRGFPIISGLSEYASTMRRNDHAPEEMPRKVFEREIFAPQTCEGEHDAYYPFDGFCYSLPHVATPKDVKSLVNLPVGNVFEVTMTDVSDILLFIQDSANLLFYTRGPTRTHISTQFASASLP